MKTQVLTPLRIACMLFRETEHKKAMKRFNRCKPEKTEAVFEEKPKINKKVLEWHPQKVETVPVFKEMTIGEVDRGLSAFKFKFTVIPGVPGKNNTLLYAFEDMQGESILKSRLTPLKRATELLLDLENGKMTRQDMINYIGKKGGISA
jgi:hypothetical protein